MKKLFLSIVILAMLIVAFTVPALAEAVKASVSASSASIKVGDTVVITPTFSASSVGSVLAILQYDNSILQFVSGDNANGPAGVITLSKWETSTTASKTMKFPLTFKAIKAGSSKISVSTQEVTNYDAQALDDSSASTTITVTDKSASTNANLKSFVISTGTLTPSFQSSVTDYTVTVPYETDKVMIDAKTEDSSATIKVSSLKPLVVGKNTRTVTVTAPSGATKTYTLTIIKQDKVNSSSSETSSSLPDGGSTDEFPIDINDISYKLVSNLTGIDSPGVPFVLDSISIDGTSVAVYKHQNADIVLVYLVSQDNTGTFFIYDQTKKIYSDFVSIKSGEGIYVVEKAPSDISYQNFTKASVTIGNIQTEAWNKQIDGQASDFYLLYAVNPDGQSGWYQYDIKEKTIQRSTEDLNNEMILNLKKDLKSLGKLRIVSYVSIAVLFLVVVLLIIFLILSKQKRKDGIPRHIKKY